MNIAEKITHLRIANGISQEALADTLNVSRQTISKWESGETLPQVDKVIEICNYFSISADELLNDNIVIHRGRKIVVENQEGVKTKYFGTDGFRGETNKVLTCDHAYKIGRFLGWFYKNPKYNYQAPGYRPKIVIGKDTRRSSYMLEYAVAAGIAASGGDVSLLHVTTTPSVAFVIRQDCFDCGVMITASHNPFYDNGIKVLNSHGEKLEDGVSLLIETYLDKNFEKLEIEGDDIPFAERDEVGSITDYSMGRNRYIAYLISLARHSLKSLKIGLDTANGSSWMIAKSVFDALGAETHVINNNPNGLNINLNAGSTHIESFCNYIKTNKLDVGFAFDGDADRCIAVDENGKEVDGDKIMYLLAKKLKRENQLEKDTLVATIMSNSGLEKALKQLDINVIRTKVGDRFVYEKMYEEGYSLGGEQSGHIIMKKYATTGDGVLTAIMVVEEMLELKEKLSKLVSPVKLIPQTTKNVRVTSKAAVMEDKNVLNKFEEINKEIGDNGRALLRQSGTEPVIRITIEYSSKEKCEEYIKRIYNVIKKRGYVCD